MTKSNAEEIKAGIEQLTPDQRKELMGEAPGDKAKGKLLTDEQVQAQLIEEAYCSDSASNSLSFDDWVQMKDPTLDKQA